MMRRVLYQLLLLFIMVSTFTITVTAQDEDYDDLLQRIDTIENPVYKPVVSLGYGVLNFLGDVRNSFQVPVIGNPGARLNIATFIDNKQFITANFFFLTGILNGNQSSVTDLTQNLNFSTSISSIGLNARYSFGHFIPKEMLLKPFLSIGIEQINFITKGDLEDSDGNLYNYWPDGSIRDIAISDVGAALPLSRDYIYETDLRSYERKHYDFGNYNPRSVGIPVELGFTLTLTPRLILSLGTEIHYTFTDFIDNVAYEGTYYKGNKGNDMFMFTNATVHFDMFSDPATKTVDLLFADIELDPIFYDDEDGDMVLDISDRCPGTPYGIVTDTLGCPIDEDADGVPDYLDKEPGSADGVWVDDEGVTLKEGDFLSSLMREEALLREDLEAYMALFEKIFLQMEVVEIPDEFAVLDSNEDGYISFDELLHVIDDYFDFEINLTLDELRQLNEFFFSQ